MTATDYEELTVDLDKTVQMLVDSEDRGDRLASELAKTRLLVKMSGVRFAGVTAVVGIIVGMLLGWWLCGWMVL